MRTLIVIPARLESTRLPRKLLLAETGKPLLWHVWDATSKTNTRRACVAADCAMAVELIFHHDGLIPRKCIVPTHDHPNGTSRTAELAWLGGPVEADVYCIVQADEPEIDPRLIDEVVEELERRPEWDCATAMNPRLYDDDPNHVKCWCEDTALVASNFTRRLGDLQGGFPCCGLHIGIYAYRREALLKYAAAGPCQREQDESLEQLRALHIGLKMGVVLTDHQSHGIDTRSDYDEFVRRWRSQHPEPQRT